MTTGMITVGMDARLANAVRRVGVGNYCLGVLRALASWRRRKMSGCASTSAPRPFRVPGYSAPKYVCCLGPVLDAARSRTRNCAAARPMPFFLPGCRFPQVSVPRGGHRARSCLSCFPATFHAQRVAAGPAPVRHAARRADRLIADNKATAVDIRRYLRVGDRRITVAPPGTGRLVPRAGRPGPHRRGAGRPRPGYALRPVRGKNQPRKNIKEAHRRL